MKLVDEALAELRALPSADRTAFIHAFDKLAAGGDSLEYPHTSAVKGAAAALRELRPQRGRCRWRAFYRRVGDLMVVTKIGPEAQVDPHGFEHAVATAVARLAAYEAESHG